MYTILITGANKGIGLELVKQYLVDGWRVFGCSRNLEKAKELKALAFEHPNLCILKLDVNKQDDIDNLINHVKDSPIDILFNNAGCWEPEDMALGNLKIMPWLETFRVNSIAPLVIAQVLLNNINRSKLKIIANMSSRMGSIGDNTSGGRYAYRSSKAALNAATRSLAVDLKPKGIIAVVLHPGWVQTDMGGPNAPISTDECVKGIKKVLSSLTIDDTGKFFRYDGGTIEW